MLFIVLLNNRITYETLPATSATMAYQISSNDAIEAGYTPVIAACEATWHTLVWQDQGQLSSDVHNDSLN